jgi:hypothetical protein
MRFAKTVMSLSLALVWAMLSSHCVLEALPGMDFFACADKIEHSSAEESHGCDEECCPVEFADYQVQRQPELVPLCDVPAVPSSMACAVDPGSFTEVRVSPVTASPLELSHRWQFHLRLALPARAPSLSS